MNKSPRCFLLILIAVFFIPKAVTAYNRTAAVNYARTWWRTSTIEPGGDANIINNPNSFVKTSSITGDYLWYYDGGSDDGSNKFGPVSYVSKAKPGVGKDCANFVSQCLIVGKISNAMKIFYNAS